MLKSSKAYGSSTVREDCHLSAAIPGMSLACPGSGFGENGMTYASIYIIWLVSLAVHVPVIWLKVIWVMRVSMAASLASGPFLTTCATFFARHTLDRWLGFPQLLQVFPHAEHFSWWDLVPGVPCRWLPQSPQIWWFGLAS